jgi:hypothetical protein
MSGVYDEIRNLVNFVPAGVPEQYAPCPTNKRHQNSLFEQLYSKEIRKCTFCVNMYYK